MTGFSPEWLALREPADVAARNAAVLEACAKAFAGREAISVCDVGAGTGASVRALAYLLPGMQHWTLVDHDDANLAVAKVRLAAWGAGIPRISVATRGHDLVPLPACWPAGTDLVTASAFFDLASEAWIGQFVDALADAKLPLLATLTFDGEMALDPPHPLDGAVAAAFGVHQGGDKGFGPAAGPRAADILASRLAGSGYTVTEGESPWLLGCGQAELRAEFVAGVIAAVGETALVAVADLRDWRRSAARARTIRVGHRDLFATPPQETSRQ